MCCCVSTVSSASVEAGLWPVDLADSLGGGAVRSGWWCDGRRRLLLLPLLFLRQASTVLQPLLLSSLHSHTQTCVAACPPEQISLRANPTTPHAVFVCRCHSLSKFYLVLYGCRVLLPCVLRGWTVGTRHTGTRPGHSSWGPGRWCSDNSSLAHPDNRNSHLLYIYYFYLIMQYVWVSSEG